MLGHKIRLNKFKKIESYKFSDHNGMKLKVNKKRKSGKFINMLKLNTLLNNQSVEEISGKIREYFAMNENKNTAHQNL